MDKNTFFIVPPGGRPCTTSKAKTMPPRTRAQAQPLRALTADIPDTPAGKPDSTAR
jgi:hypothetical protein